VLERCRVAGVDGKDRGDLAESEQDNARDRGQREHPVRVRDGDRDASLVLELCFGLGLGERLEAAKFAELELCGPDRRSR